MGGEGDQSTGILGSGLYDLGLLHGDVTDSYFLFSFHSHLAGGCEPSIATETQGDLLALTSAKVCYQEDNGLAINPFEVLVGSKGRKTVDAVIIQENGIAPWTSPFIREITHIFDAYCNPTPKEVVTVLEKTEMYRALHIKFTRKGIAKRYRDELERFEFTPQLRS